MNRLCFAWPFILLTWSLPSLALAAGDPKGQRNLASDSPLPRGPGLAVQFNGDHDVSSHPAVVFADNFEKPGYKERWDSARDKDGRVLNLASPGSGAAKGVLGQKSLRVTAVLDHNTGGGLTKWFQPVNPVFVRFYAKFNSACDYVHHFVTLRANKSWQGGDKWSGFGGAGVQPKGDERFSTALEPWGNWRRYPPPGRWNFYSYWHEMSASGDGKYWGNSFAPAAQPDILRGTWICAEFMLKENTPGQADGEQAFWIDGKLKGHWQGINWRKTENLHANALTMESYVTDRWTKNQTNIVYFDNLVIASEYIGPAGGM